MLKVSQINSRTLTGNVILHNAHMYENLRILILRKQYLFDIVLFHMVKAPFHENKLNVENQSWTIMRWKHE